MKICLKYVMLGAKNSIGQSATSYVMGKESKVKDKSFLKPPGRGIIGLLVVAALITTGVGFWQVSEIRKAEKSKAAATAAASPVATRNSVTALGRLSPQGKSSNCRPRRRLRERGLKY